jgi:hypothetical protein
LYTLKRKEPPQALAELPEQAIAQLAYPTVELEPSDKPR